MPDKRLLKKLRTPTTPTHRITTTLTLALHARMLRCMELEGHMSVSEFAAVAISRRCREIEAVEAITVKMPL